MKFTSAFVLVISTFFWCDSSPSKIQRGQPQALLKKAVIFGDGIISTEGDEFGACFSPDGRYCYFCKRTPSTITSSTIVICYSHMENGNWTEPEIAPFSGQYKDFNPSISPDGLTLFFISNRPSDTKKTFDTDIWLVHKTKTGWSEPENAGATVNSTGWELGCTAALDGTLYFSSTGPSGNADLYYTRRKDGVYQSPQSLGASVNSAYAETDPFIAPDQHYILFTSQGRPDAIIGPGADSSYPRSDIYISFNKNGIWSPAKHLGNLINTEAEESSPWVSGDGKTMYFTSERNFVTIPMKQKLTYAALETGLHHAGNGLGDIYQVAIEDIIHRGAK